MDSQNFEKTSSILHCSKSESNLLSFQKSVSGRMDTTNNFNPSTNLTQSVQSMSNSNNNELEDMVTSTPAQSAKVQEHEFQTPQRRAVFLKSSTGSSKSRFRYVRSQSETSGTPSSVPRLNPFDSHLDRLHLPTCSPSVFSIVVSPSQEAVSSSSSGKFWSLDQQARLFPAHIADDSPWKQEAASSRLDKDTENRTQEALNLYFSRHHNVTTPEDVPLITVSSLQNRSDIGNSPDFTTSAISENVQDDKSDSSSATNISYDHGQTCRSTQTALSFPMVLPSALENMLVKYGLVDSAATSDEDIKILAPSSVAWGKRNTSEGNISNSTLRRKLFAGMIHDDDEDDDDDDDTHNNDNFDDENDFTDIKSSKVLSENKENCESTAMVISPGKIMMTPNAQKIPSSPNKSLSWSLSPVSRQKRPNNRNTPIGISTPTRF